jgi:hypothetical protein
MRSLLRTPWQRGYPRVYLKALVSAVLNLYFGKNVLPSYGLPSGPQRPRSEHLHVHDLMRARQPATDLRFRQEQDRGGSGHFKSHWGLEPMYYEIACQSQGAAQYTPTIPNINSPFACGSIFRYG